MDAKLDSFFPVPGTSHDHDPGVSRIEWVFLQLILSSVDNIDKLEEIAPTENHRREMMEAKWYIAREICEFIEFQLHEEIRKTI